MEGSLQLLSNETSEDKDTEAYMYVSEKGKRSSVARVEDFRDGMWLGLKLTVS